jgi:hypothetical protein
MIRIILGFILGLAVYHLLGNAVISYFADDVYRINKIIRHDTTDNGDTITEIAVFKEDGAGHIRELTCRFPRGTNPWGKKKITIGDIHPEKFMMSPPCYYCSIYE